MKNLKAFYLHCYPSPLVSALMTLQQLICEDVQKEWIGFCAKKRMKTIAVSSFGFKSYPVLCRDDISFQGKGKLDWQ